MKNIMIKIQATIVICILFLMNATTSRAQYVEIGARFMPTFSAIDFQTPEGGVLKGQVTLGTGYGGFIGFSLGDHFGLQAEVIYNSINQTASDSVSEQKLNLQYLNIPLLMSFNTGKTNPVNLNFVVGPQMGINLASKFTTTSTNETTTATGVVGVKKGDLGVAYGAGIDFGLNADKTLRLGIGFRGVYGLIDISDQSKSITTDSYYVLDRTHLKTYSGYIGLSIIL